MYHERDPAMTLTDQQDLRQRYFDRIYEAVQKAKLSNDESYDRAILTLSSAALAVSIHFALSTTDRRWSFLLFAGWFLLGTAAALVMAAYKLSNFAQDLTLDIADEYYNKSNSTAPVRKNTWEARHQACTFVGGLCLLAGMCLLAIFFGINLPGTKGKTMSNGTNSGDAQPQQPAAAVPGMGDEKVTAGASSPRVMRLPATEERAASSPRVVQLPTQSDAQSPSDTNSPGTGKSSGGGDSASGQ